MPKWSGSTRLLIAITSFVLSAIGCNRRVPEFSVDPATRSATQLINESAIILIGRIANTRVLGHPQTTANGVRYQVWRIDVDSELLLRGTLDNKRFAYYLHNYAAGAVQNGDFDWLEKGDHRIFFLRREGSLIRAVSDLNKATIVYSHRLPGPVGQDSDQDLRRRIARPLLTPSNDEPMTVFASSIPRSTTTALRVAGYAFTSLLLAHLLESKDPSIRNESCLSFYEQAFGDEACFTQLEQGKISTALRMRIQRARERRAYLLRITESALREGRDSPFMMAYTYKGVYNDPDSAHELFEYLAHNSNRVFRLSGEKQLAIIRKQ